MMLSAVSKLSSINCPEILSLTVSHYVALSDINILIRILTSSQKTVFTNNTVTYVTL